MGLTTNLASDGLLEHQVQRAIGELDLEALLIGQRQQRAARLLERFVAPDTEILVGESHVLRRSGGRLLGARRDSFGARGRSCPAFFTRTLSL